MTFYEALNAAIEDLLEHGFDSKERLDRWLALLARTMQNTLVPERTLQSGLRSALEREFNRVTSRRRLYEVHKGISEFTIKQIQPKLRAELDRRIFASASLIKLNRQASIS